MWVGSKCFKGVALRVCSTKQIVVEITIFSVATARQNDKHCFFTRPNKCFPSIFKMGRRRCVELPFSRNFSKIRVDTSVIFQKRSKLPKLTSGIIHQRYSHYLMHKMKVHRGRQRPLDGYQTRIRTESMTDFNV